MSDHRRATRALAVVAGLAIALASAAHDDPPSPTGAFPWREAGLDARAAAAHLLDRFAFGPRPGQVDEVVSTGLEAWLEAQLAGPEEPELATLLAAFPSLELSAAQLRRRYHPPAVVRKLMERDGLPVPSDGPEGDSAQAEAALERAIASYARSHRLPLLGRLLHELRGQKLVRAVHARGQLREVLTDFWLNHFNVSLRDAEVRSLITAYERDAIRPHVAGRFRDLLGATAAHPAMLLYLDNARSFAEPGRQTLFNLDAYRWRRRLKAERSKGRPVESLSFDADAAFAERGEADSRPFGLNENYARELLELHTLGAEGGFGQADVLAVARAFTGWSVVPGAGARGDLSAHALERLLALPQSRFMRDGLFLFRPDAHDAEEKTLLGHRLAAGRAIEDGREVLDILARQPATARHLAHKLAVRFVSDAPPAEIIDHLAATFLATDGDLAAMIRALARSPHFWSPEARRSKIKLPFELAASALRALDVRVERTGPVLRRVGRLGQRLYAAPAPDGYPQRAEAWVSSGSLLGRMRFGLDLAAGRIDGIRVDPARLGGEREPASLDAGLQLLAEKLLPGRDVTATVALLRPLAADPRLPARVAREERTAVAGADLVDRLGFEARPAAPSAALAYLAGLILGSPEFQRR